MTSTLSEAEVKGLRARGVVIKLLKDVQEGYRRAAYCLEHPLPIPEDFEEWADKYEFSESHRKMFKDLADVADEMHSDLELLDRRVRSTLRKIKDGEL